MGPTDNSVFILLCAPLVMIMQLGFAMIESGLVESRHCISVMFKNVMDLCIGVVAYVFIGAFIQSYPDFGFVADGWSGTPAATAPAEGVAVKNPTAVMVYNAVFAATAATIISGTLAGRVYVGPYLILSTSITLLVYPLVGRIFWGPWGSLTNPIHDLAGSVVVHTVGGMAALGAALALTPRTDPSPKPHNQAFAVIGTLTLWFGWYGFNCGSIAEPVGTAAGVSVAARVALNTTLAAAAGGMFVWLFQAVGWRDKSLPEVLNGILGGLVIVTASADIVSPWWPVGYGLIAAGIICVWPRYAAGRRVFGLGVIDDPVGAIPVHGFCGMAGGFTAALATGSLTTILWQIPAVIAVAVFCTGFAYLLVTGMNRTRRLRVRVDDRMERHGLDHELLHEAAYRFDTDPNTVSYLVGRLRYLAAGGSRFTYNAAVWEPGNSPDTTRFKYAFFRWYNDALSDALKAARGLPSMDDDGESVSMREWVRRRFKDVYRLWRDKVPPKDAFEQSLNEVCQLLENLAGALEDLMAERRRYADITGVHETRIGELERQAHETREAMARLLRDNQALLDQLAARSTGTVADLGNRMG